MALFRLIPEPLERVWGSTQLEPWFPNQAKPTGEVWFTGVPDAPLLIKFLFTSAKLSVQVHPSDAYALSQHGSRGKTEMWHVLRAAPGARIAAGFREEISERQLRESARTGEILNLLQWYDARVGDTFFIPAGTVHAIGEGLVLCEIQQNSDVTYRLYDYGRPRELHLDHAVNVSRRGPHLARAQAQGPTLASCEYFTAAKIDLSGTLRHQPEPGGREWWIVLEGSLGIDGQPTRAGEVYYVPPGQAAMDLAGEAVLLRASTRA
ncbi:MAG TPA: class I mannose-6-phosphate isomerase [Bryobacteraceae bacterium]|nr:class I mannose-6-phosphate isomerase [Bryobacteraceae bacterium]